MANHDIDCDRALRQILVYIDHELDAAEHDALEQHLRTCKSCYSRMDFERRLKAKVAELRQDAADAKLNERIKSLLDDF
jgi:anti-sigma factor (TIGR02949 family)